MKHKIQQPHVVIIGAGFGGLRAAKALADAAVQVTLIDRYNYHLFQPLLYQVATAGLSADEIAYPVRGILQKQKNLNFRLAEVSRVNLEKKKIITNQGEFSYDHLILAVGSETNFFGNQTLAQNSFSLKNLTDAEKIRSHILYQFEKAAMEKDLEKRKNLYRFVIVGGGPTGVEMAGAISELIRLVLKKDFPNLNTEEVEVILVEAIDRLLPHLDKSLSTAAMHALQKKGVQVQFGKVVESYDGEVVRFQGGEKLPAATLIWAAGVHAANLVDHLGVEQASLKQARVLPTLQIPDYPDVFLIGDAAYVEDKEGKPLPMVAPVAMQQAEHAVSNLKAMLNGEPLEPFEYKDLGSMATIGRNQAVAQLGRFRFRGFLAWLIWLFVHLMQLVGFRNRMVVLLNWAWEYISYDRAVRLLKSTPCESEER
ncbi:MAG: FAD-dependent oxidoreductase [Anaerolineaceae bacterium]|nr:FAD-dependent oxidoreductase [Anaerolineaceae bacterium]